MERKRMFERVKARWVMFVAVLWFATGFLMPNPPVLATAPMPAHAASVVEDGDVCPNLSTAGHVLSAASSCLTSGGQDRAAFPSAMPVCCPPAGLAGCCVAITGFDMAGPATAFPHAHKAAAPPLSHLIPPSASREVLLPPPRTTARMR